MTLATHEDLIEMLHQADVALFYKDLCGRYLFINEAGARMVERSVDEIVGHEDGEIFTPRTAAIIGIRDHQIAGMREPMTYDARSVLRDQSDPIHFRSVKAVVRTPFRREPTGLVCLSIRGHRAPDVLSGLSSLMRGLMQFSPECLLDVCRRGARLRLV